jgi:cephalosporin hydroxylase
MSLRSSFLSHFRKTDPLVSEESISQELQVNKPADTVDLPPVPSRPEESEIGKANRLTWIDDQTFVFSGIAFDLSLPDSQTYQSTPDKFLLVKSKHMIEYYQDLLSQNKVKNILDIGIFKGGSLAFFQKLCSPDKIVGIDIENKPNSALAEFIRREDLAETVRPIYSVNQADSEAVQRIIKEEFGNTQIDLIIDDGCHYLDETRKSFNAVFRYLRNGGLYVVEDWGWAHWPGFWQDNGGPWKDRPATTSFIFELVMLATSRPDIIENVMITNELATVRKGNIQALDPGFEISKFYLTAGRTFLGLGNQAEDSATP